MLRDDEDQPQRGRLKSHFGKAMDIDGSTLTGNVGPAATTGMGETGAKVNAPTNNFAVMFVEINYRYTPTFSWVSTARDLRFVAYFVVRDPRDLRQIYSPDLTLNTCGYAAQVSPP